MKLVLVLVLLCISLSLSSALLGLKTDLKGALLQKILDTKGLTTKKLLTLLGAKEVKKPLSSSGSSSSGSADVQPEPKVVYKKSKCTPKIIYKTKYIERCTKPEQYSSSSGAGTHGGEEGPHPASQSYQETSVPDEDELETSASTRVATQKRRRSQKPRDIGDTYTVPRGY